MNNNLDTASILAIIEAAGTHGVLRLKFGRLELEFGTKTLAAPVEKEALPEAPSLPVDTPTIERSEDPPNQEEIKAVREVEKILRETALQNLQLENPFLYEQLLSQGELEDEPGEENELGETQ